jgi:LPS-assembly protein
MAVVTTARPTWVSFRRSRFETVSLLFAVAAVGAFGLRPAVAQQAPNAGFNQTWVGVPAAGQTASSGLGAGKRDPNAQMLVKADRINYDYSNSLVTAAGNVQLYYSGSTVEADKVSYDQKTKRLRAEGNVRLTEADGNIVTGEILDLNENFRDGFIDSLRLEAADKTRFAAPRVERAAGATTVFQSGTYTACEPCKDDPTKPPVWQVKAGRIIHDEAEKMIYFENARLEVFGVPMFWAPFMSAPDPTVKRKSGILIPTAGYSSTLGATFTVPYYFALAPNYDLTVAPTFSTTQGVLLQGEYRQRFENGGYSIRASGIIQADPGRFVETNGIDYPGNRTFRGHIDTSGQFALNDKWVVGWDALLISDQTFFQDYNINSYSTNFNSFKSFGNGITDAGTSQVYLQGRGERSFFDARAIYTYGLSLADKQEQLPIVHPVIDYFKVLDRPVLGGELGFRANLTSLTRQEAEFNAISQAAINSGQCALVTADPAFKTPANCLLRGVPGTTTRATAEATWRRTFIDPVGQVFTPFASLRADVAQTSITAETGVANFINTGDSTLARVMPTVGLEYRYPFISVQSWGTQTIEPIAQVIVRPNETGIGKLPNEDAQSLVFDDTNLFAIDKFSGFDRVEGGGRANVGIQYTAQFNQGGFVNALFGQSYQLFGQNSFAVADNTNTGLNSGLQTAASDYVARLSYAPDKTFMYTSRFRFDQNNFTVQRAEFEGRATFDRWSVAALYGNYAAEPNIGLLNRRDGVLGSVSFKISPNWSVLGSASYDVGNAKFNQYRAGLGYIDDCFAIGVSYITGYSYGFSQATNQVVDANVTHAVLLQISLRTLGTTSFNQSLGPSNNTGTGASNTGLPF